MHTERPDVAVGLDETRHGVCETPVFAQLDKQARRHPTAQDRIKYVLCEAIGMTVGKRGNSDDDVGLLGALAVDHDAWASRFVGRGAGARCAVAPRSEIAPQAHGVFDHLGVAHPACDRDHKRFGPVVFVHMGDKVLTLDAPHALAAARDISPERVVAPKHLVKHEVSYIGRRVERRTDLLDDNLALLSDFLVIESRAAQHIGEHFHSSAHVRIRHKDPVIGVLVVGGRVHISADTLDGL
jgi:hypothetical protein